MRLAALVGALVCVLGACTGRGEESVTLRILDPDLRPAKAGAGHSPADAGTAPQDGFAVETTGGFAADSDNAPDTATAPDTDTATATDAREPCRQPEDPCLEAVDLGAGCELRERAEGSPCDDGIACTAEETCEEGACVPAVLLECDPPDMPCVEVRCLPKSGCTSFPVSCDDGDACTADHCDPAAPGTGADRCRHGPMDCDDGNPCTDDFCKPGRGCLSSWPEELDGEPCDDGDPCTGPDVCRYYWRECVGPRKDCHAEDPCTSSHCDAETGHCFVRPRRDLAVEGFEAVGSLLAFGRGDVSTVLAEDGVVYSGLSGGKARTGAVEVFAVGETGALSPLGRVSLHGLVRHLEKVGDVLLAAGGLWGEPPDAVPPSGCGDICDSVGVLWSMDVSDPERPALVSRIELGGLLRDVSVDRAKGFLAATTSGGLLYLLDVNDPAAPVLVDHADLNPARESKYWYDIEHLGGSYYVAARDGSLVAAAPVPGGGIEIESFLDLLPKGATRLIAARDVLLAAQTGEAVYRLEVGGAEPSLEEVPFHDTFVVDLAPSGDVWVAARGPAGGIATFSSVGGMPAAFLGSAGSLGSARAVATWGRWAFLADGFRGVRVYDLSDLARPVEVAAAHRPGMGRALDVRADAVYAADGAAGLQIVDAADPVRPVEVARLEGQLDLRDVEVRGDIAFCADAHRGVVVVDVADPLAPSVLSELYPGVRVHGVGLQGDYLYAPADGGIVAVLDIGEPAQPRLEKVAPLLGGSSQNRRVSARVIEGRLFGQAYMTKPQLFEGEGSVIRVARWWTSAWLPGTVWVGLDQSSRLADWEISGGRLVESLVMDEYGTSHLWRRPAGGESSVAVGEKDSIVHVNDLGDPDWPRSARLQVGLLPRANALELMGDVLLIGGRELWAFDLGTERREEPDLDESVGASPSQPGFARLSSFHRTASVVQDMVRRGDLLYLTGSAGLEIVRMGSCADCISGTEVCRGPGGCMSARCADGLGCVVEPIPGACDDGDPCTADLCGADGECTHNAESGMWPCAEEQCSCNASRVSELCGGEEEDEPAGFACEPVTCDPGTGVSLPDPFPCDDGNPCTLDACDPAAPEGGGGCSHEPVAEAIGCGDADPCNGVESCLDGACVKHEPVPCPADSPCGPQTCEPYVGCVAASCDDGDPCTRDSCGAGGCEHVGRFGPGCRPECTPALRELVVLHPTAVGLDVAVRGSSVYWASEGGFLGCPEPALGGARDTSAALAHFRLDARDPGVTGGSCLPPGGGRFVPKYLHAHGERVWLLFDEEPVAWITDSLFYFPLDGEGRPGPPVRYPIPQNTIALAAHNDALLLRPLDPAERWFFSAPSAIWSQDNAALPTGGLLLLLDGHGDVEAHVDLPGPFWDERPPEKILSAGRYVFVPTTPYPDDAVISIVDREAAGGAGVVGAVGRQIGEPVAYADGVLLVHSSAPGGSILERVDLGDPRQPRVLPGGLPLGLAGVFESGGILLTVTTRDDGDRDFALYALEGAELPRKLGDLGTLEPSSLRAFEPPYLIYGQRDRGLVVCEIVCEGEAAE